MYKFTKMRNFLIVLIMSVSASTLTGQVVNLGCQTEDDAFEGLERKDWNSGSTAAHSEGSMHNFTLPDNTFGDCKRISNVLIEINAIGVDLSNLPVDCPPPAPYYYNIATNCPDFTPASCNTSNLVGEPNTPTFTSQNLSYNNPPENFQFGENLSIDIVPVMNIACSAGQSALTSDAVILDYEICVTVTIIDETIDTPVDISGPSIACPLSLSTLSVGPYSEYDWGPNGETTQSIDVAPGIYTITVTDDNGCTDTDEFEIMSYPTSSITFDPVAPEACEGSTVSVSVSESYANYSWSNGMNGQTVDLSEGMTDVIITDANNCLFTGTVDVTAIPNPNAGADNSETICDDVIFDLLTLVEAGADAGGVFSDPTASGALAGSMIDASIISGQTIGFMYTVGLPTDPCGQDVATLTITVESALNAGADNSEEVCDDINFDLNSLVDAAADTGGTFSDPTSSGALTGSTVNTSMISGQTIGFLYTVGSPSDACGTDVATLTLTVDTSPNAGDDNTDSACDGDFFDLVSMVETGADAGGTFSDPSSSGALTGSIVNTLGLGGQTLDFIYEVGLATDPCGVDQAILSLTIDVFETAGDDDATTVCEGTSVDLNDLLDINAAPGGTFSDPSSSGTLTGSIVNTNGASGQTIDFVYTVGDAGNACGTDEAILSVTIEPSAYAGEDNATSVCEGTSVDLNDLLDTDANGGGTFSDPLSTGVLTGSIVNTSGLAGQVLSFVYTVGNAADPCGEDEATFIISVTSSLEAGEDNEVALCLGGIIDLNDYLVNADPGGIFGDTNGSGGLSGDILNTDVIAPGTYIYEYSFFGGTCPFDFANIEITFSPGVETVFELDTIELCYDVCQEINLSFSGDGPFTYDLEVQNINGTSEATTSLSSTTTTSTLTLCNSSTQITFDNDTLNFSSLDSLSLNLSNLQGSGCDAMDTLWFTSLPKNEFIIDTTICILDTLFVNDLEFYLGNSSYIDTLEGIACDSFININVSFSNIDTSYILETICPGDSVNYFSTWFDEDNLYQEFPVANQNGCDSLFIVDISLYEIADSLIDVTLCQGDFIEVNGTIYNETNPVGQEIIIDASINGCDSIVNINLLFDGGINIIRNDTICEGSFVVIGGTIFDQSNSPGQIVVPGIDCDTIFDVDLTFAPNSTNDIDGIYCSDFDTIVNGTLYDINNPIDVEIINGGSHLGCDSIIFINLQFDNGVEIIRTDTLCEGSTITIGGVLFDQTNTSDLFNVAGSDCDTIFDVDLTFVGSSMINITGTFCSDFDTIINGNVYDINNPADTEIIPGGNYLGCDSIIVVDLQFDNGVEIIRTDTLCEGNSITIGGVVFDENNTMDIFNVPGVDCDTLFDVALTFVESSTSNISGTFCSDFDTLINGNIYDINNPSDTEIIAGGNYLGCDSIIIVDLMFTPCDLEVIVNSIGNNCVGDSLGAVSIQINSPINIPFVISLEENTSGTNYNIGVSQIMADYELNNLPSGTYTLSIIDNTGATLFTTTETITDLFPALGGDWNLIDTINCEGDLGQLEFVPTGGQPNYNFIWNDQSLGDLGIINQIPASTYAVTVSDMNGCTYDSSFEIIGPEEITFSLEGFGVSCAGIDDGIILISNIENATEPYSVLLNGNSMNELSIDSLAPGDYTIQILDSNLCSSPEQSINIPEESNNVLADYTLEYEINIGDSIDLEGELFEQDLTFNWEFSASLDCVDCPNPVAFPTESSIYNLTIQNAMGCMQMISIIVNVNFNESILIAPNIFSPNGDGINDDFVFGNDQTSTIELTIFDRWGNQMHNSISNDGTLIWDGTSNNNDLITGVYVYQLSILYLDGTSEIRVGDITIVR